LAQSYTIDRFEEYWAVLISPTKQLNILRSELPLQCREGDILQQTQAGWVIDTEATAALRKENHERLHRLFAKRL